MNMNNLIFQLISPFCKPDCDKLRRWLPRWLRQSCDDQNGYQEMRKRSKWKRKNYVYSKKVGITYGLCLYTKTEKDKTERLTKS